MINKRHPNNLPARGPESASTMDPADPISSIAPGPAAVSPPGSRSDSQGFSRRQILTIAGSALAAGAAGWAVRGQIAEPHTAGAASGVQEPGPSQEPTGGQPMDQISGASDGENALAKPLPETEQRPGITFPSVPQRHAWFGALALPGMSAANILELAQAAQNSPGTNFPDAGTVTVTIGFGPAVAHELWPQRAAKAAELPAFKRETEDLVAGGEVGLQICAETKIAVQHMVATVLAAFGDPYVLWSQHGYRDAPTANGTTRTSSGFVDGVANPRTAELLAAGVWSNLMHRDAHLVLRRMQILPQFAQLSTTNQEQAIGRRQDTGAPLSGGAPHDNVDLFAKTPDGHLLTPSNSHVRRAHPANMGLPLMLRRSYSFDPEVGTGLVFVAFVGDPQTFVQTQQRMDQADDLIKYTVTDSSGCFFVPGDLIPDN
ncbi:Dyp-type peroxidase [Jonesiaceae bacterium BS-20]|uniref:Dyp-type peroxidase n=1 Tax=Jonesiaceae bacterium BS-20 TaxID=3120821 RepID=A0AAU7DW87_9MICO